MNKLGKAIKRSLEVAEMSQKDFAERCGVSPQYICNIVAGQPPGGKFLSTLVNSWDSDDQSVAILIAHLWDEVERAGRTIDEIEIRMRSKLDQVDAENAQLERLAADLDLLEQVTGEQTMREKIHFLAELARQSNKRPNGYPKLDSTQHLMVAEDPPPFDNPVAGVADLVAPRKRGKSQSSKLA